MPRRKKGAPAPAPEAKPPAVEVIPPPAREAETSTGLVRRDPLDAYLAEVGRYQVLPPEEQIELARKYQATGNPAYAYRLVTTNLRLVVKIAHEYRRAAFSLLDLIQEGNIGLMQAVKKFDPYRGVKLSSYAAWWIRAYIIRYVMDNWRLVKLGTTRVQRRLFFNLRKEKEKLAAMGFEPGPKLLAERLQVTEQDVIDMDRRLSQDELSLDTPMSADNRSSHADHMALPQEAADEALAQGELMGMLRAALARFGAGLVDREKVIFEQRLVAESPLTLQEIGDKYGISRERARQIEAGLTRKLRAFLEEEVPEFKDIRIGPAID